MKVETKAGDLFADGIRTTVEDIEEEVRERIEDAIRAAQRFELDLDSDTGMVAARNGDWLSFDDVMDAVKRGNW